MKSKRKTSPTQRSLQYLRELGYKCAIVEHWNPHAMIRQDLFGFVDLLAIRKGETLAVQTTTSDHLAHRIAKLDEPKVQPLVAAVREAGWKIHMHGWKKNAAGRWVLREVDVS